MTQRVHPFKTYRTTKPFPPKKESHHLDNTVYKELLQEKKKKRGRKKRLPLLLVPFSLVLMAFAPAIPSVKLTNCSTHQCPPATFPHGRGGCTRWYPGFSRQCTLTRSERPVSSGVRGNRQRGTLIMNFSDILFRHQKKIGVARCTFVFGSGFPQKCLIVSGGKRETSQRLSCDHCPMSPVCFARPTSETLQRTRRGFK